MSHFVDEPIPRHRPLPMKRKADSEAPVALTAEAVAAAREKADTRLSTVWAQSTAAQGPERPVGNNFGDAEDERTVFVTRERYRELISGAAEATSPPPPEPREQTVPVAEPDGGPDTWGNWRRLLDATSGRAYYHDATTNVVCWERPAGWGTAVPRGGWWYTDLQGVKQGPFSQLQLSAWRGVLSMNLSVWWQEDAATSDMETAKLPLAHVTGDLQLLQLVRSGQLSLPANATACQAEAMLAAAEASQDEAGSAAVAAPAASSFADELAQAALEGLPADVRARVLAGDTGEAPTYDSGAAHAPYEMRGVMNKRTGRVTLAPDVDYEAAIADKKGAPREYVTAQLAHHMDVGTLNEWLEQRSMHQQAQKPLPPAVWQALKQRRLEKKRKGNAWLRD
jgi:WW domain